MECVLYAVGSPFVYDVHETLCRLGWSIRGLIANQPDGARPVGLGEVVEADAVPPSWVDLPVVIPLLTPGHRAALERELRSLDFATFPSVVDPTAVLPSTSTIGEGAYVNAGAVVGSRTTVGRFAVVNRSASVGHDVVIDDFSCLGPGCVLCGGCRIATGAFVGAGATLLPGVTIGANAVVGAGSVVTADVAANAVVFGNPATVVRTGSGYNDVAVSCTDTNS